MKNPNVRAIVAYEPGSGFVFPEGEVPRADAERRWRAGGRCGAAADFMKLTKIPIVIYYGDNIPEQPTTSPAKTTGGCASPWRGCGAMP